jgi:hypothetical protein
MKRLISDAIIFLAAILVPWWVVVPAAAYLALGFRNYYEFMVLGLILDALYSLPMPYLYGRPLVFTLGCILIFVMIEFFKPQLRLVPGRGSI